MSAAPSARDGRLEYHDLADLEANPGNYKTHPAEQLEIIRRSVARFGYLGPVACYNARTGFLIDGHARKEIFAGKGPVPVWVVDIPAEDEAEALATYDPSGWCAATDRDKFSALLEKIKAPDGPTQRLLANLKASMPRPKAQEERPEEPEAVEIPLETVWPSDNVFGVPSLDAQQHAQTAVHPITTWGSQGHTRHMGGTWHFYTHDYKFEPIWRKPAKVRASGANAIVEPNFSLTDQTPLWVALWHIGRKRWLGRYWQACGLKLFVDLNVDARLNQPSEELNGLRPNLLGVPLGYPSYASRAHGNRPEALDVEYEVAREWSGRTDPLFLVVGGGQRVKALARDRGWIWSPEQVEQSLSRKGEES